MDGWFVPNISFGPMLIRSMRHQTHLPLDVHLMVQDPERYLADFADAGAAIITVHVEASVHLQRVLQQIRDLGCQVGLALNPATPVESIREVVEMLDLVLVMSVNPGFGGQKFIPAIYNKLRRMRTFLDQHNPTCALEVDGGVGVSNIADVVASGADVLVVGSAVFNDDQSVGLNLSNLRDALDGR